MPWKHNNIAIKAGKAWSDKDGVQHPANWMIWTDPEKKDKGLTWEDEPDTSFDNRFYWSKGVERSLTDILVTDENGEKVLDPMTGKQLVQEGLKTQYIAQTKQTANDMLSETDWMIVRNAEKSTAIPEATTKFRDSVRTKCAEIETAINACSGLADFIKLFDVPVDKNGNPTGNAPMYDWPTE
tara:strand:- start:2277 stop:2825 length:549 start_codon:yes stop_codon:yes gene_type:complete